MKINFELYKVFYYVAKHLSFSGAALELFITQSAVSQAIGALEKEMKCKLFIRNTKQVRLTQEGTILFKHVEQAYNLLRAGERSIQEIHSLLQGEVRIGASDTICKYYLLPYLKKFNKLYPQVKIKITNRTSPVCIDLLRKGQVDVSIINVPEGASYKNMPLKKIKAVQDVFIAGNNFIDLKDKAISLKELEYYPILMLETNTVTRDFFDAWAADRDVRIVPEIELGSMDLLVEMARIGLGISLVTRDYLNEKVGKDDIFVLELKEKIPERSLGIITNDNIPLPIAGARFIELLG